MAIFNSYVSLPEGTWWFFNELGVFENGLDHLQMVGSMGYVWLTFKFAVVR